MRTPIFLVIILVLQSLSPSSSTISSLKKGSSLSVEKTDDVLVSPNGVFSAGFYSVGENAFCFAIWFTQRLHDGSHTIVWMANRDQPVNGRLSKLKVLKNGDLILTDAGQLDVWSAGTGNRSISNVQLQLNNTGNLVLLGSESKTGSSENFITLWQSFDWPTDTLLPHQRLTRYAKLVSSRSRSNYSSGYYKLFFDNDNFLKLLYDGPVLSSLYWPDPWLIGWQAKRSPYAYGRERNAVFNTSGHFQSTDGLEFRAADYGVGVQRRLTMDVDGNARLYSLDEKKGRWTVSWQAMAQPCRVHGICGPNSFCTHFPHEKSEAKARRCTCLPGYNVIDPSDWSLGCKPNFITLSCKDGETDFIQLPNTDFYGYDLNSYSNYTLEMCVNECLKHCDCVGFQFEYISSQVYLDCYPKKLLVNGYRLPLAANHRLFVRLPKDLLSSDTEPYKRLPEASLSFNIKPLRNLSLDCSHPVSLLLDRSYYKKPKQNAKLKFMVSFAFAVAGFEIVCICVVGCFIYITQRDRSGVARQRLLILNTGFRKFTYNELKKASRNFSHEIGRGGSGIIYKGVLQDGRVAAIKLLINEANYHGKEEFMVELTTIGSLNHMNLIEMWGYCVEGKHRLLVYEYMEHGSLAETLSSSQTLNSHQRFDIAVGTAKGLAYLHEECLEWVLHCDVKPQNILLDGDYQPKVADFGLSKLLNRAGGNSNSSFSRIRGTRGYMAPEWILNLHITSKVDVYSYGMVVLEMVTGKTPMIGHHTGFSNDGEMMEVRGLVNWVREKISENGRRKGSDSLEKIVDPKLQGEFDVAKMEVLVDVALRCVEEDRDARPTMSQVIEMLLRHENDR
ncbi:putative receptor protein kinase ZmPK1 isoform X1 [Diospyros lotus]|uniref:putative receptor protein kinase ZmPK1 isoform X1 n=1 Tax=Diospyros lotus TaxID=55363 RepID=UPI00224EC653|nr:putative receptor protein kinase ZmPK1 isoform X1 [Diospyros lotus]